MDEVWLHYLDNETDCCFRPLLVTEYQTMNYVWPVKVLTKLTFGFWAPSAPTVIFLKILLMQFYLWKRFHKLLKFNSNHCSHFLRKLPFCFWRLIQRVPSFEAGVLFTWYRPMMDKHLNSEYLSNHSCIIKAHRYRAHQKPFFHIQGASKHVNPSKFRTDFLHNHNTFHIYYIHEKIIFQEYIYS